MEEKLTHSVRPATQGDIPAIVSVTNAAFSIQHYFDGPRTDAAEILDMMTKGTFLLAVDVKDDVLASVFVRPDGEAYYFGMLAVQPGLQRHGLGQTMIDAAESYERSQGRSEMHITVLSLRSELLPFYEKRGYRTIGTAEFHSRPDRPLLEGFECYKILMSKSL